MPNWIASELRDEFQEKVDFLLVWETKIIRIANEVTKINNNNNNNTKKRHTVVGNGDK